MDDAQLYDSWYLWLIIGGIIIIAAAALLLLVILAAKRILKSTDEALTKVKTIKNNTLGIWELSKTNSVTGKIKAGSANVERHLTIISEALEKPDKKEI